MPPPPLCPPLGSTAPRPTPCGAVTDTYRKPKGTFAMSKEMSRKTECARIIGTLPSTAPAPPKTSDEYLEPGAQEGRLSEVHNCALPVPRAQSRTRTVLRSVGRSLRFRAFLWCLLVTGLVFVFRVILLVVVGLSCSRPMTVPLILCKDPEAT